MKNNVLTFLIIVIGSSLLSFVNITQLNEDKGAISISVVEDLACKYRQCNATAKSTGNRCKHCVSNSDDYQCYQHK